MTREKRKKLRGGTLLEDRIAPAIIGGEAFIPMEPLEDALPPLPPDTMDDFSTADHAAPPPSDLDMAFPPEREGVLAENTAEAPTSAPDYPPLAPDELPANPSISFSDEEL